MSRQSFPLLNGEKATKTGGQCNFQNMKLQNKAKFTTIKEEEGEYDSHSIEQSSNAGKENFKMMTKNQIQSGLRKLRENKMKHKLKHKKFVSELTKVSNERFPGFH
jgi:hypothetical protein